MRVDLYTAGPSRRAVVTDENLLTPTEIKQHPQEVNAAILEELKTWVKYGTFRRAPRRNGLNILTSRFVAKWKRVEVSPGKWTRIIRMRLCLRGFQDLFAHLRERYSGTASRATQKLLCSEFACQPGFIICTIDIEKAFLQGLTVKEVADATGTQEEETYFTLPPGAAAILRQIDGYEDYNEYVEVLLALSEQLQALLGLPGRFL